MKKCTVKDKTVQVLMSTYNGEKYLSQQIDSILSQKFDGKIKLLIRDDGSIDNTKKILKNYLKQGNIEVIFGENIGVNKSVFYLVENRDKDCDYYAFSDQDDVWKENKLQNAVTSIIKEEANKENVPILYASSTDAVDENLNFIRTLCVPKKTLTFYNAMIENILPGHTQVFNNCLADIIVKSKKEKIIVIDWWIYMIASAFGRVCFSKQPSVLYRQHSKNSIGYEKNFLRRVFNRFKRVNSKDKNNTSLQLLNFYNEYKKVLPREFQKEIKSYFKLQKNFFKRCLYAFYGNVYRQEFGETIIFKILYVFGKYKL